MSSASQQVPSFKVSSTLDTSNPILVHVYRGETVESRHRGAFAVVGPSASLPSSSSTFFSAHLVAHQGDIETPVFPRSAIKALQCLGMLERGGAERFGLTPEEIALLCASHNGEELHARTAQNILKKLGLSEEACACGTHWSFDPGVMREMARRGETPTPLHHNCSGKHAGMLALARLLEAPVSGYETIDHPVQKTIFKTLQEMCGISQETLPWGIDGCSVPTWALPLKHLALGFHRLVSYDTLPENRRLAARQILEAVRAHPFMVAGTDRFCTKLMMALPRVFVKMGAEGVFCAAIPHAQLGIALKCDDGANRAAEVALAGVLRSLDVWTPEEQTCLETFSRPGLSSARGRNVGHLEPAWLEHIRIS